MIFRKMYSKAFNIAAVLAVVLVLSAAVFMVHSAFEKSVKTEIFIYAENLRRQVSDTASGEYKRYLFLVELAKNAANYKSENELKKNLENIYNMVGPEGTVPDLVSGIGYYLKNSPVNNFVFDSADGFWKEDKRINNKKITGKKWEINTLNENQHVVIILSIDVAEDIIIFFKIDRAEFINIYVKPAVKEVVSELKLLWINTETDRSVERERFKIDSYRFRPLNILAGITQKAESLTLAVPGIFSVKKYFDYSLNPLSGKNGDVAAEEEFRGRYRPPENIDPIFFLNIKHPEGSFYHDIEYKEAVRFTETVLIFFLIGLLFILMLCQLQKTANLRKKEKAFVASVTHELRTPLTVIRSAADNLSTGIVPAEKMKIYSDLIIDNSSRLGTMIEEILLYSGFEDKKRFPVKPVLLEFEDIFRKLQSTLGAIASAEGISLYWDINGLPEKGYGDPQALIIVTENLVSNAVFHAYEKKAGKVRIKCKALIPEKLRITVEDDGRGIEPHEMKHIFDPFYRDELSRQRQEKGSGLGLFISKQKVLAAGGSLIVQSPYKRIDGRKQSGCRFTLTLPLQYENDTIEEQING